ncbi:MAG: N-6 DNA methylase [Desulfosalsimonadaceae bacterium]
MTAPDRIVQLVETFHNNLESYKRGIYNETQARLEFINPFFEALGWDMNNAQGFAESYKDVIHEDAIKVGGVTKAPDYCFRIGGTRKFFLEAKKPSVNIKDDMYPAFQLRRYAWSAKLPLSVLTDFEEFAVYDCRVKPSKTDKVSHSRIMYVRYEDYLDRWGEIANIFSKQAILKGSFDQYVKATKVKKGTTEVDAAFLEEIERWRDLLARNFALRNTNLSQRELNFAVQQTIDRIIFLRICEDRGIEKYGRLMALQNGADVYPRLFELFRKADEKYNSGLFHFKSEKGREDNDALTPNLAIDDKVLKDIFKNLYYPDSPYEFSVLSADILGQVYEKFLGKIITLTSGHQARIEEKPEVRKAGGVYYTPTYIVDYIVKNTVGSLLEDKKPGPRGGASKLKILDPACGSGSFLIGAYQYLMDWHLEQYLRDGADKWTTGKTPRLYQTGKGDWRLTTDERKRILLNNIYGVDIDPQAVEVTKLSLLLKVLEGESEESIGKQMVLFQERVLPDLSRNIKCGNSLINPDYYDCHQMTMFCEDDLLRVNAFDWNREFPEIMKDGGFDAVIGNPPYVRQETLGDAKSYFQKHYQVYHGTADLYAYFIEKSISLLNSNGLFGIIVSNKWIRANYGKPLREWMIQKQIVDIIDFGDLPVFKGVAAYPCILFISNAETKPDFYATVIKDLTFTDLHDHVAKNRFKVSKASMNGNGWTLVDEARHNLLDKLRNTGVTLKEYVQGQIFYGIKTGLNEAFVIDSDTRDRLIAEDPKSTEFIKPFALGRDIKRYQALTKNQYLILIPKGWTNSKVATPVSAWNWFKSNYPAIATHLEPYAEKAKKRCDQGEFWWELRTCDYYGEFEEFKIIVPAITKSASYTFDDQLFYSNDKTSIIATKDLFVLGILSSKISDYVIHSIASTKQGGFYEYKPMYIQQIPIAVPDMNKQQDKHIHDQISSLVKKMLELNKQLQTSKLPHEKNVMKSQIETTDNQINQLVYQLYGLTAEEIQIIESEVR